jgi:hypothetical protein
VSSRQRNNEKDEAPPQLRPGSLSTRARRLPAAPFAFIIDSLATIFNGSDGGGRGKGGGGFKSEKP